MNKIKSINIFNMCVPCACHCKYCLLNYERKIEGIDFKRSINYAIKFKDWLNKNHPDIHFMYYFGYSMETRYLIDNIDILNRLNCPSTSFLQFNGMKMRSEEELKEYLILLKQKGIKLIDLTFHGNRDTHDSFADRKGDFDYLIRVLNASKEVGLESECGIAINKDNLLEIDDLVNKLASITNRIFIFTPHSMGKGTSIFDKKITISDLSKLSHNSKKYLNRDKNKTQSEWYNDNVIEENESLITLSLLPINIDKLEHENIEDTYNDLVKMDENFYSLIPSFKKLLSLYYDSSDIRLYTKKDLYTIYRRRYINDHKLDINDIDERYTNSIRV